MIFNLMAESSAGDDRWWVLTVSLLLLVLTSAAYLRGFHSGCMIAREERLERAEKKLEQEDTANRQIKGKAVFEKARKDNRRYCQYAIYDLETGEKYVCGKKWKRVEQLRYNGWFLSGLRLIREYEKTVIIKGKACKVFFWAGLKPEQVESVITVGGAELHLRGDFRLGEREYYPDTVEMLNA